MFDRIDDTIVAISSAVGRSVRALIRLSGPDSCRLAEAVFADRDGASLLDVEGHRRLFGRVEIDGGTLPAELYVFRAPASYTRQDIVELHVVGSPVVLEILLDRLVSKGARMAEPGEFTARAYFAGAIDLTGVEGVAAVIHARSDAQLRASEALLHGRLSQRTTELRDRLADLLSLLEAEIDFSEEEIDFIQADDVLRQIAESREAIEDLLEHSQSVERLAVLPEVMLVGCPNAGKSTLFNRLTGMERVIASAMAGTTRDVISAPISLADGEAMLLDSAGVTSSRTGFALDELAEAATQRALASVDLVVLVIEACDAARDTTADTPDETLQKLRASLPDKPAIVVLSKADRLADTAWHACEFVNDLPCVAVSAVTGKGVDELRKVLSQQLFAETQTHGVETLALSNRQRCALRDGVEALVRASALADENEDVMACAELLALEVREAMNALSLLTGEVATEDLLGRIFEGFCIGK